MRRIHKFLSLIILYSLLGGQVIFVSAQTGAATSRKPLKEEVWVGRGYDITDKYADVSSVRESIFNIGADNDGDPVIFEGTEMIPIDVLPNRGTALDDFFGRSVAEYQTKFSTRLSIEGNYKIFSGHLKSSFDLDQNSNTAKEFATLMHVVTLKGYKLPFEIESGMIKPAAQKAIDTSDPLTVFKRFGTHYIWQAEVGGRVDFNFTKNDSAADKTLNLNVDAKAAVSNLVGSISVENETKFKSFEKKIEENGSYKIVTHGGSLDVGAAMRQDRTALGEWTKSVETNPTLCRFGNQSLRPIWDLASTPERKAELEKAFAKYVKAGGIVDTTGRIDVRRTSQLEMVGTNYGSQNHDKSVSYRIGVFSPIPDPEQGYFIVGQAVSNNNDPKIPANVDSILVKELGERGKLLAPPINFSLIYKDNGTKGDRDWSIWRANCPVNFVALGYFAKFEYEAPDPTTFKNVRCVHKSLVEEAKLLRGDDLIHTGQWTGGDQKLMVYKIKPPQGSNAINGNFFYPDLPATYTAQPPSNLKLYVLKNQEANAATGGEGSITSIQPKPTPSNVDAISKPTDTPVVAAPTSTKPPEAGKTISQDEPLDEAGIEALLEILKSTMEEVIEDEAQQKAITAKWEAKLDKLEGKSQKQVLEILFADVKSVVKTKKLTDDLWETWSSIEIEEGESEEESDENSTEGMVTTLDADTKKKLGSKEEEDFTKKTAGIKFNPEAVTYKGQSYVIYKTNDSTDPELKAKVAGIQKGVRMLIDLGFKMPQNLSFFCTTSEPKAQAFKRYPNWDPMAHIIFGKDITLKNNKPSVSMQKIGEFNKKGIEDKTTLTTIHEIGHILHERYFGYDFWVLDAKTGTLPQYVSYYSEGSQKEFVAEVFTAAIAGKKFCSEVMDGYKKWGGPQLPFNASTGQRCGQRDSILESTSPDKY